MSEEDKKAIEYFEKDIEKRKQGRNYFVDYEEVMLHEQTILNLIKSQQETIEKLSNNNKRLLKKLRNRVKEVKKLTKYSLYKKEFSRLNKELEKKNKIIKQLKKENRELKIGTNNGLDKNKRNCFYEDGHTGKCLGYSFFNDDEPCIYCQTCEAISIKGDD